MTRIQARLRQQADAGFTLIEVLAAMVVFALVALAGTGMIINSISISRDTRNRTQAASIASQQLEVVRNASTQSCWVAPVAAGCALTLGTPATTTSTQTVGSQRFTVTQSLSFLAKAAPTGSCDAPTQGGNTAVQPVLLVNESVTWAAKIGSKPVSASTEIAPPVGTFTGKTGGISVKILDHANAPVANIPVTVTSGGTTLNLVSNADGCTFAAYLAPNATYAVSVAQAGYVDNQNLPVSVQNIGVTSGAVSTATFYYDRAATINVSYVTGGLTAATGLPTTVYNAGISGLGTVSFASGVTALTPLYPYPGYGLWAGHCPEANPSAVDASNTPLYPGASQTNVPTTAGGSTSGTAPLYPLAVTVKGPAGAIVPGATLSLTETAGSAGSACTTLNTYGLTASDATGLSQTAVPLGHFTVTATLGTRTATVPVFVTPGGVTATVTLPAAAACGRACVTTG